MIKKILWKQKKFLQSFLCSFKIRKHKQKIFFCQKILKILWILFCFCQNFFCKNGMKWNPFLIRLQILQKKTFIIFLLHIMRKANMKKSRTKQVFYTLRVCVVLENFPRRKRFSILWMRAENLILKENWNIQNYYFWQEILLNLIIKRF